MTSSCLVCDGQVNTTPSVHTSIYWQVMFIFILFTYRGTRTWHIYGFVCIYTTHTYYTSHKEKLQLTLNSFPLDRKMAANLADDIFKCIFINEIFCILIRISLKFVPMGPIDNRPALVQVMAWHRTGNKPLPEPTLTQFTDAYMWYQGEMIKQLDIFSECYLNF